LIFLILLCGLLVSSCKSTKEKSAEELLENSKMEDNIYSAILNDSIRFSKFMNQMAMNERSKIILSRNSSIVKMMCMSEKMDSLMSNDQQILENLSNRFVKRMEADSFVCDHTCTRIMENEYLKKYFIEHGLKK
jgi:cobalamin biosynthesis Mg chelatase CobN